MKIYLAGPMRGIPEFNFPAFNTAARMLRAAGHEVFNPAERDTKVHGEGFAAGNATGSEEQAVKDHGFSLRDALADDTAYICKHAEVIALLPDWGGSKGAKAEYALASALGLKVIEFDRDLLALPPEPVVPVVAKPVAEKPWPKRRGGRLAKGERVIIQPCATEYGIPSFEVGKRATVLSGPDKSRDYKIRATAGGEWWAQSKHLKRVA